jgi:hypothetical protein
MPETLELGELVITPNTKIYSNRAKGGYLTIKNTPANEFPNRIIVGFQCDRLSLGVIGDVLRNIKSIKRLDGILYKTI